MKWIFALALIFSFGATQAMEKVDEKTGLKWYTDLEEAHKISKETNKPVFGFFTGSDWCGWCHKLQREVFAKQAFIDWAKANVILLEVDFPRKTPQSNEQKVQNQNLQQAFRVTGYPTIWIFDTKKDNATGQFNLVSRGSLGYPSGAEKGKEEVKFLNTANKILAAKASAGS